LTPHNKTVDFVLFLQVIDDGLVERTETLDEVQDEVVSFFKVEVVNETVETGHTGFDRGVVLVDEVVDGVDFGQVQGVLPLVLLYYNTLWGSLVVFNTL